MQSSNINKMLAPVLVCEDLNHYNLQPQNKGTPDADALQAKNRNIVLGKCVHSSASRHYCSLEIAHTDINARKLPDTQLLGRNLDHYTRHYNKTEEKESAVNEQKRQLASPLLLLLIANAKHQHVFVLQI